MSPTNPKKRSFAVRALRPNSSSNDRTGTKAAVQVCAHPGESGDLGERCHLALPECIASMAAFALCSAVAVSYANNEPIQCQLLALHKGGTRRKLPLPSRAQASTTVSWGSPKLTGLIIDAMPSGGVTSAARGEPGRCPST